MRPREREATLAWCNRTSESGIGFKNCRDSLLRRDDWELVSATYSDPDPGDGKVVFLRATRLCAPQTLEDFLEHELVAIRATVTEETVLRTIWRTEQLRITRRGTLGFRSNNRVPELARGCVRNAQWITPTR